MPFITTVKLSFQGPKILECGTQWVVVIKKWTKITKHKDVTLEPKAAKIEKELRFTKWENFIT